MTALHSLMTAAESAPPYWLREAVQYRDYPMLQGVFLLSAVLVLVSLAAADLVNRRLDREEDGL